MHSWLQHLLVALKARLDPDDEEDFEEGLERIRLVERILPSLPALFPREQDKPTILIVPDMHSGNIRVNDAGDIVAILDWESTSF